MSSINSDARDPLNDALVASLRTGVDASPPSPVAGELDKVWSALRSYQSSSSAGSLTNAEALHVRDAVRPFVRLAREQGMTSAHVLTLLNRLLVVAGVPSNRTEGAAMYHAMLTWASVAYQTSD